MMDGATWWVGTAPSQRRLQCQATGQAEARQPLQVLLTGKPCRNFQVLVAYSMLQMVRKQVLQESMTGDDILLVRAPSGPARPGPTGSWRPPTPTPSLVKAPGSGALDSSVPCAPEQD